VILGGRGIKRMKGILESLHCILDWSFLLNPFLEKKCVFEIKEKGGDYGSKFYFDSCNGKWLMYSNLSCWFGFT
jgi:hypothetical protein